MEPLSATPPGHGAAAPLLGAGATPSRRMSPSPSSNLYQTATFPRGMSACSLAEGASGQKGEEFKKTQRKLVAALVIAFVFMIVEVVGGIFAHSLAIITDAAHLLSDVSGFAVSVFAAVYAARRSKDHFSYGYHRVEVLGALGSIMVIWLVTGILLFEAAMRIINPEEVNGKLMFIIAMAGIGVNLLMLVVLGGHHHGHSHGHDHGHSHSHEHASPQRAVAVPAAALGEGAELSRRSGSLGEQRLASVHEHDVEAGQAGEEQGGHKHHHAHAHEHGHDCDHAHGHDQGHHDHDHDHDHDDHDDHDHDHGQHQLRGQQSGEFLLPAKKGSKLGASSSDHVHCSGHDHGHSHSEEPGHGHSHGGHGGSHGGHSHGNMNVRGAVLHVIGDLVQSIGVAIAGALIWANQGNPKWYIADPICTFLFALLVIWTTIAIVRDIADVLMERVPRGLCIKTIHDNLTRIPGVEELHDLHVWSLTPGIPLLCTHANLSPEADPTEVLHAITAYCRSLGIEHSTVQLVVDGDACPCSTSDTC